MIRIFDFFFSLIGLLFFSPVFLIFILIGYYDSGSPIFRQLRMGKDKRIFYLVKFRSMYLKTPSVPTHLASASNITPFGRFLRKSKIDELPQLWNVLLGDMSLVGPRPNLINQTELIEERDNLGVYSVRPGITGLAQINRIDMSTPKILAVTDAQMIQNLNIFVYFKYIILTIFGRGFGDRIVKS